MKELPRVSEKRDPIHGDIQSYAAYCVLSRKPAVDAEELRRFAAELMNSIAAACFGYGAKEIGHIKAHLEYEGGFLSSDTLGSPEDVMVEGEDGPATEHFTVLINSVVFGLDRAAIERATEESLTRVSTGFGMTREGDRRHDNQEERRQENKKI